MTHYKPWDTLFLFWSGFMAESWARRDFFQQWQLGQAKRQTPSTGLRHPSLEEGAGKAMLGVWHSVSVSVHWLSWQVQPDQRLRFLMRCPRQEDPWPCSRLCSASQFTTDTSSHLWPGPSTTRVTVDLSRAEVNCCNNHLTLPIS